MVILSAPNIYWVSEKSYYNTANRRTKSIYTISESPISTISGYRRLFRLLYISFLVEYEHMYTIGQCCTNTQRPIIILYQLYTAVYMGLFLEANVLWFLYLNATALSLYQKK